MPVETQREWLKKAILEYYRGWSRDSYYLNVLVDDLHNELVNEGALTKNSFGQYYSATEKGEARGDNMLSKLTTLKAVDGQVYVVLKNMMGDDNDQTSILITVYTEYSLVEDVAVELTRLECRQIKVEDNVVRGILSPLYDPDQVKTYIEEMNFLRGGAVD